MLSKELLDPEFLKYVVSTASTEDQRRYIPYLTQTFEREKFESDYESWIQTMFPQYATAPLAEHHRRLWEWIWSIEPDKRPPAFVAIWPRGGGKSSTAEMACAALGARGIKKYILYVCRTQEQADDHVQNIAAMLEGATVEQYYPELGEKLVGKHGNSKGWRRSRVRTASGLTIDAIGLDTASRGVKLEENRPDGIWLDELDLQTDSPKTVRKMTSILTKSLLPSGSEHVAILYIQNLIHPNGIAAKLVSGEADYLRRRILSGPIPALEDFAYEQQPDNTYAITSGTPTWVGFNVQRCEDLLNEIGPRAFREECQHDVNRVEGAFWSQAQLDAVRIDLQSVPDLVRIVIGVDPSGGDAEGNDEQGIVVGGIGTDGKAYILADLSCKLKPNGWGNRVIYAYENYEADAILGEPNYGGQMVESTIRSVDNIRRKEMEEPSAPVKYTPINATRGKVWRAEPVAALFGDPDQPDSWALSQVHLAGAFPEMEEELRTWFEGCGWSPNRADAMWMVVTELLLGKQKKTGFFFG